MAAFPAAATARIEVEVEAPKAAGMDSGENPEPIADDKPKADDEILFLNPTLRLLVLDGPSPGDLDLGCKRA